MKSLQFVICIIYFHYLSTLHGQDITTLPPSVTTQSEELEAYNATNSYCFRFTWLGSEYDDSTPGINTTCEEILEDSRAVGVPCHQPLVITHDGTPPDVEYMWNTYKMRVACKMQKGQVCAKYSYYFNNAVQNVTYMCTKVFAHEEGAITSGCYKQQLNGDEVQLCVCTSRTGDYIPCNSATRQYVPIFALFITVLYLLSFK